MHMIIASNPFFSSFGQSDTFGKFIFIGLFFLSILSWTTLIYKVRIALKLRRSASAVEQKFKLNKADPLNFSFNQPQNPFYIVYRSIRQTAAEILQKNRSHYLASSDIDLINNHLETVLSQQMRSIEKNLYILPTVVSLAPFLGLLGTVWGILIALGDLQASHMGGSSQAVLGGIAMALGTTVLGLLVAIPPLIGYAYLRSLINEVHLQMRDFSSGAVSAVEMQYRKVDVT